MPSSFLPFSLSLLNAQAGQPLDFGLYAPHGGGVEPFLEAHPDFVSALQIEKGLLQTICRMEADTFSAEVATEAAKALAAKGYAVGLMTIHLPREIIDMNRTLNYAVKPWFDFIQHPELLKRHRLYFDQILEARRDFLTQIRPEGKWIDVHSMRPFNTPMDSRSLPEGEEPSAKAQWYAQRIQALKHPDFSQTTRTHCIVAHYKEHAEEKGLLFVDPILLEALKDEFTLHEIPFNVSRGYYFTAQIAGKTPPPHYSNGICIDLVKNDLCREPWEPGFDLEHLTPDKDKITFYGERLANACLKAEGRKG